MCIPAVRQLLDSHTHALPVRYSNRNRSKGSPRRSRLDCACMLHRFVSTSFSLHVHASASFRIVGRRITTHWHAHFVVHQYRRHALSDGNSTFIPMVLHTNAGFSSSSIITQACIPSSQYLYHVKPSSTFF